MAITKIHPIKTTLNLSIDYICDPAKTDEEILISSFLCGHKTAALEFAKTKEKMNSQSKNLARHLIQSFMPGEVSPELAHTIGQDLCDKHLQRKYEYVLTTHVDKGHIHNHIIFNNVNHLDGKAYISNKRSYHQIRNISDSLCRVHQLSIASESNTSQARNKTKGSSYKEYQERKNGNSYKAKLQYAIDLAIKKAKNWDDFLRILQSQGYEIKYGKHISFKAVRQERFTRAKTIGDDYTEDKIKERIADSQKNKGHRIYTSKSHSNRIVDISTNQLASRSEGFAKWLKLQNLKIMSKSWNEINENNLTDIDSFNSYIEQVHDKLGMLQSEIKVLENDIDNKKTTLQNLQNQNKYHAIYKNYLSAKDRDKFFRDYETEIIIYEAADNYLSSTYKTTTFPQENLLTKNIECLTRKSSSLYQSHKDQKEKVKEVNQLRQNLEDYLRQDDRHYYKNIKEQS
ncbi:Relaxase/Mobilisation nuclease domain-containing protein [Petrocella atlantisensis]|uniref:Relaxase/Mobilisation nuclease domain-containing protein n=1 Tax=Petrocella atlantisensis TaxID=2173034 RepID=A0A3P7PGY8_9FIRM|nr:relaxase/mobilization nuclease domain-containing protein [Petrocella atlantisensis]VDN49293.1 Relaxase/Mobilisation nuclease domain-containing protein [Petrocella atlantisensis]